MRRWLVYLWVLPTSLPGLVVAVGSPRWKVVDGVLEVHGGLATWILRHALIPGGASAMTLGHVVLGRTQVELDRTRSHERVHVRQCERWGPLFLPAYLACSAWLWFRGKDAYLDNPFEIEAYGREAGCLDDPPE